MKNKKYIILFVSICFFYAISNFYSFNLNQKVHAFLLGSQNATPQSTQLVRDAMKAAGFENTQDMPVRIMNRMLKMTNDSVLFFTADSAWINEDEIKALNEQQKYLNYYVSAIGLKTYNPNQNLLTDILVPASIGILAVVAYQTKLSIYTIAGFCALSFVLHTLITLFITR